MRILIVSNCNTNGLQDCLNFHAPQIEVDSFSLVAFKNLKSEEINLKNYDILIGIADFFQYLENKKYKIRNQTIKLEQHFFSAFHPDVCFIRSSDRQIISTSMSHYNSIIILYSYLLGVPNKDISSLFNDKTYRLLGYYNYWDSSVAYLKRIYNSLQIDVDDWVQKRSIHEPFMHSPNHPKIYILSDLVQYILKYLDLSYNAKKDPPIADHLAKGFVWPVYNEIANYYGFQGDYIFKSDKATFNLQSYIDDCLNLYNKMNITIDNLILSNDVKSKMELFRSLI